MDNKFHVSYETARLLEEKGCPIYGRISKAEAIDWLESKGIIVEIQYYQESSTWSYAIYCICYMSPDEEFQTRLEAEEAAIIKALELL